MVVQSIQSKKDETSSEESDYEPMQATKSTFKNVDYMIDIPKIIRPKFFEEDNPPKFSKA
jgi:hypothetical protein